MRRLSLEGQRVTNVASTAPIAMAGPVDVRDGARAVIQYAIAGFLILASSAPYLFGDVLALVLVASLATALVLGLPIPRPAVGWAFMLAALGAVAVLRGSISGHEGALSTATIFVIEPLLLGLLLPIAYRTDRDVGRLLRALDVALLAASGLGFILYVNAVSGLSLPVGGLIDPRFTTVDLAGDTLRTNFQGYNSLVFLCPYGLIRAVKTSGPDAASATRRLLVAVAAIAGLVLSGRQALYLATPLALLTAYALTRPRRSTKRSFRSHVRRVGLLVLTMLLLNTALSSLGLSLRTTIDRTFSQITLSDESGVRPEQSRFLLEKWLDSPALGHGAGTTVDGYVRSAETPWSFELSYHVILITFGAVGFVLLGAWTVWIVKRLRGVASSTLERNRSVLAGFVGALVAAASNPYFFKIEGIWMAFVPFAVAIVSLRSSERMTVS